MGYLLKEALKTLCGVNQWAYAVFWKIGCHDPELLIWEECYYKCLLCSDPSKFSGFGTPEMSLGEREWCLMTPEVLQAGKIQLLIDRMMDMNQIVIMGEGITGRAAVTGNHQWFLSKNFNGDTYPPQVSNEMHNQFSAGIETVVVIPVSTLGVVQLGSSLSIMENMGFVNTVRSLILQLGCIQNALFSANCSAEVKAPVSLGMPCNIPQGNCQPTHHMVSGQASQPSAPLGNVHDVLTSSVFQNSNQLQSCQSKASPVMKTSPPFREQSGSSFLRADEILHNPDVGCDSLIPIGKQTILCDNYPQHKANEAVIHELLQLSDSMLNDPSMLSSPPSFPLLTAINHPKEDMRDSSKSEEAPLVNMMRHALSRNSSHLPKVEFPKNEDHHMLMGETPSQWDHHFEKQDAGSKSPARNIKCKETSFQQQFLGDDLFDVLGVELKNKILGVGVHCSGEKGKEIPISMTMGEDGSDFCAVTEGLYECDGILSGTSSDHLLDAVVSRSLSISKHSSNDNLSCKTTLTKATSFCGSQVSSWLEQNHAVNVETIVPTGYSKRSTEVTKPNRKRLKPGENPRPRPKDRQMIQDHLKELREIVPNGAKCSIDALLERTIKHMLFLESVTKHADKLKESGESMISSKEGGLLLKDNSDGGATWAFEVGSQSMVCPIIVEDLNSPRQILVEMLCENQGLFLEIADMIRGLGLTILKGVMEARNDKVWARFSVEANRDITRMEIFMSFIRLLDQNAKTSEVNSMDSLHSCMQPASIPAMCGPQ